MPSTIASTSVVRGLIRKSATVTRGRSWSDIPIGGVIVRVGVVMAAIVLGLALSAGPASGTPDGLGAGPSGDLWASDAHQAAVANDLGAEASGDQWASDAHQTAVAAEAHSEMWANAQRSAVAAPAGAQVADAPAIPEVPVPDEGISTLLYIVIAGGVALVLAVAFFGTRTYRHRMSHVA